MVATHLKLNHNVPIARHTINHACTQSMSIVNQVRQVTQNYHYSLNIRAHTHREINSYLLIVKDQMSGHMFQRVSTQLNNTPETHHNIPITAEVTHSHYYSPFPPYNLVVWKERKWEKYHRAWTVDICKTINMKYWLQTQKTIIKTCPDARAKNNHNISL